MLERHVVLLAVPTPAHLGYPDGIRWNRIDRGGLEHVLRLDVLQALWKRRLDALVIKLIFLGRHLVRSRGGADMVVLFLKEVTRIVHLRKGVAAPARKLHVLGTDARYSLLLWLHRHGHRHRHGGKTRRDLVVCSTTPVIVLARELELVDLVVNVPKEIANIVNLLWPVVPDEWAPVHEQRQVRHVRDGRDGVPRHLHQLHVLVHIDHCKIAPVHQPGQLLEPRHHEITRRQFLAIKQHQRQPLLVELECHHIPPVSLRHLEVGVI